MELKAKQLHSPGYSLLFDIIAIPNEAFFISIDEFVDLCGIPCQVFFFNDLYTAACFEVRTSVHPILNLCTYWFTADFAISFSMLYTIHILQWISLLYTLFAMLNMKQCDQLLVTRIGIVISCVWAKRILFNIRRVFNKDWDKNAKKNFNWKLHFGDFEMFKVLSPKLNILLPTPHYCWNTWLKPFSTILINIPCVAFMISFLLTKWQLLSFFFTLGKR